MVRMRTRKSLAALTITMFVLLGGASRATAPAGTSSLWGERGEKWNASSPLPDVRYAGYLVGRAPIPEPAVVADVKTHGAVGDGKADDTAAFVAAVKEAAAKGGAVNVPAGRYVLTDVIRL